MNTIIHVETVVNKDVDTVWECWTDPAHITKWAFASEDWEVPHAENDLTEGGNFLTRMSAKDGSASFDFTGTYTYIELKAKIEYVIADGRTVDIAFSAVDAHTTLVTEEFEMEQENSEEMQRGGWQAILENFKKYTESK